MTINLPHDLERFLRAEVVSGHFASEEDAVAAAVRLLRQQLNEATHAFPAPAVAAAKTAVDPVLGAMRDAADELDDIVAHALSQREQQPWRLSPGE